MSAPRSGTAGRSIPRPTSESLPGPGTHLERYARTFPCAEINSTFYRPHRASTWTRWVASVPEDLRFSVKAAKTITHEKKLVDTREPLLAFLAQARLLGSRLGPLLPTPAQARLRRRGRNRLP